MATDAIYLSRNAFRMAGPTCGLEKQEHHMAASKYARTCFLLGLLYV